MIQVTKGFLHSMSLAKIVSCLKIHAIFVELSGCIVWDSWLDNQIFYEVELSAARPTQNLVDQGIPFGLGHHPWPVQHGRPCQQLCYHQHSPQGHLITWAPPLQQRRDTFPGPLLTITYENVCCHMVLTQQHSNSALCFFIFPASVRTWSPAKNHLEYKCFKLSLKGLITITFGNCGYQNIPSDISTRSVFIAWNTDLTSTVKWLLNAPSTTNPCFLNNNLVSSSGRLAANP
jgi:hypothetical protein